MTDPASLPAERDEPVTDLYDHLAAMHRIAHGNTCYLCTLREFAAPAIEREAATPSVEALDVERLIADMPVATLATDGGPAVAYAMRVEEYLRARLSPPTDTGATVRIRTAPPRPSPERTTDPSPTRSTQSVDYPADDPAEALVGCYHGQPHRCSRCGFEWPDPGAGSSTRA